MTPNDRSDARLQAVLDALPATCAVLDANGVMTFVNQQWREFGRSNDADPATIQPGVNYLEVCRRSAAEDPRASSIAKGLEQVVSGRRDDLTLDYPCHSPTKKRWFRLYAARLVGPDHGTLITHVEVTPLHRQAKQLQDSMAQSRAFRDSSPNGVMLVIDGKVASANVVAARLWRESTPAALLGHSINELFTPEQRAVLTATESRGTSSRPEYIAPFEMQLRRKDGSTLAVETTIIAWRDGDRATRQITFRDLSELITLRQAEENVRLAKAEASVMTSLLNSASRLAKVGGWSYDITADELRWTEQTCLIHGVPLDHSPTFEEAVGYYAPEDRERVTTAVTRCKTEGLPYSLRATLEPLDGPPLTVLTIGEPVRDASGTIVSLRGAIQDITLQDEAERKIRRQAALIEAAGDAMLVVRPDSSVVFANVAATRLFDLPMPALLEKSIEELLGEEQSQAAIDHIRQGLDWTSELDFHSAKNQRRVGLCRIVDLPEGFGDNSATLVSITDVTVQHELERQLVRSQRLESLGTLAGGIAHDLNNVLGPIVIAGDLLEQDITEPRSRRMLASINQCANRGIELVRQVLIFARGLEGQARVHNPAEVLEEVVVIVRETFPRGITLNVDVAKNLWPVRIDPTHLHQVLLNLAINARDAMGQLGTLTFRIRNREVDEVYASLTERARVGTYVQIMIGDTGKGIAAEHLPRIFEPFFSTKPLGEGTGLGLSTTHTIITQAGGFINVYSEPGVGTRFKIYLPAVLDSGAVEQPVSQSRLELPRGEGELVLLVDDEEEICELTGEALRRHGYDVVTAEHGAAAVALYASRRDEVAVVLTDMSMPIMDGPTLIVALKALDPDVQIIGSSGLDKLVSRAADAGVQHFIPKPYTLRTLLQTLARALGKTAGVPQQTRGSDSSAFIDKRSFLRARLRPDARPGPSPKPEAEAGGRILIVEDSDNLRMMASDAVDVCGYTPVEAASAEAALALLEDRDQAFALLFTDLGLPGLSGLELAMRTRELRPELPILFASGTELDKGSMADCDGFLRKPYAVRDLNTALHDLLSSQDRAADDADDAAPSSPSDPPGRP